MSKRRRWTPVRGRASRVYEPRERLLLGAFDLKLRSVFGLARLVGLERDPGPVEPAALRDVLVLRLDRIGDVVMCLPALDDLRRALPSARVRLVVGEWARAIAERAPVDEVLVWSAPWVGRRDEGASSTRELFRRARALAAEPPDLALDLQGDVRANLLLRATGALHRVGYANTGGASVLTQVVPLDETLPWPEQNRLAVAVALGHAADATALPPLRWPDPTSSAGRESAAALLEELKLTTRHPLVGIHPSGGRAIKQWPVERWVEVARQLQARHGAAIVVTGSAADTELAARVVAGLAADAWNVAGRLDVAGTLALLARLDLFLSPDTGPMHMACAVGTPSVSVFGPSDPRRYFSGGDPDAPGARHRVVAPELWCAPCNLIRRPPAECATAALAECLDRVSATAVVEAADEVLSRERRAKAD